MGLVETNWSVALTEEEEENPCCPFCKEYMEFEGIRSEPTGWHENNWVCIHEGCFRRTLLTISFKPF